MAGEKWRGEFWNGNELDGGHGEREGEPAATEGMSHKLISEVIQN
jgi:hypothetical protein